MSRSAFAGFCLTAFAGGVITTVVVDRFSGRDRSPVPRTAGETAPIPGPIRRPTFVPEFQALPPKGLADTGQPPPQAKRPVVSDKATKAAIEPIPPVRPAVRARTIAPRKAAAGAASPSVSKSRDELEVRAPPRAWADPFAD
jgi:hypothetical protein